MGDGSFRAAYASIAVDDDAARARSRGVARLMARGPVMHLHDSCHHLLSSGEATRGSLVRLVLRRPLTDGWPYTDRVEPCAVMNR